MTEILTLSDNDRHALRALIGRQFSQIVWDLNAIYFAANSEQIRIRTEIRLPPSTEPNEYDEAACIKIESVVPALAFRNDGEAGNWYRVVAHDATILNIEIVRTGICMPAETPWSLATPAPAGSVVTPCDCGVLITSAFGVLPAVQLENSFGFANWPDVRWYQREEVLRALDERYQVVAL